MRSGMIERRWRLDPATARHLAGKFSETAACAFLEKPAHVSAEVFDEHEVEIELVALRVGSSRGFRNGQVLSRRQTRLNHLKFSTKIRLSTAATLRVNCTTRELGKF
jgi:hypothetical protein